MRVLACELVDDAIGELWHGAERARDHVARAWVHETRRAADANDALVALRQRAAHRDQAVLFLHDAFNLHTRQRPSAHRARCWLRRKATGACQSAAALARCLPLTPQARKPAHLDAEVLQARVEALFQLREGQAGPRDEACLFQEDARRAERHCIQKRRQLRVLRAQRGPWPEVRVAPVHEEHRVEVEGVRLDICTRRAMRIAPAAAHGRHAQEHRDRCVHLTRRA